MNDMNNKIIFKLLQAALFQKEIDLPENVEWDQVFQEMKMQTVAGIPYEWLSKKGILDENVEKQWSQTVIVQMTFWVRLMQEQEALVQLMKKNNINIVILKGTAAAIYYPRPDLRVMGDVDFLVDSKDFQKAYGVLLENGYQLAYEKEHATHHVTFIKNKVAFEIHKGLAIIVKNTAGKHGEYIQNLIEKGLSSVETKYIERWEFPMFPRLQNGLVLLLHIVQHLKTGLGLRQIVDWMMFVDKELDDKVWKLEFEPVIREIGLKKMAITLTRMCQLYLGLRTEDITWCLSANPSLCDELLEYFMEKGNFGKRVREKESGIYVLSTDKNLFQFLKKIQRNGRNNWEAAKKYPILTPFAWIYQICRYARRGFNREYPIQTLIKDCKKSKKRIHLFNGLKLFEK